MHYRSLCLCSHSATTVARRGWFNPKSAPSLGGLFSRCHFINPSFQLQAPSQKAKNGIHDLDRADSTLNGLSSEVDKELRELLTIKQEEAKDVFIDDLFATLDAHRTTNRAAIVRKLNQKANEGSLEFKRPVIGPKINAVDAPAKDGLNLPREHGAEVTPKPLGTSMTFDNTNEDGTDPHGDVFRTATRKKAVSDKQQVEKPGRDGMRSTNWPADSIQNEPRTGERKRYSIGRNEILEYDAMYIAPRGDYRCVKYKHSCPWLAKLVTFDTKERTVTASRRLYDEIRAYENYMKMNPTEIEAARLFTAEVKSIIRQKYPDNPLNPIGSHSTGLADRLSDFDFTLSFPDLEKPPLKRGPSSTRPSSRRAGNKALMSILGALHKSRRYQDIELVSARVPIVKAIHSKTQLRVELQTLSSNEATREYSLYFLTEFPTLRPLYVLFRSALHLRQLHIVYEGGLGSYSVLIMIVNALKHASGKYARDDLVNHFLHVLDFYSTANLYKHGFSPDPPRTFRKNRDKISTAEIKAQSSDPMLRGLEIMRTYDKRKPYLLCLQDPANAVNDLGCRSYGIKHVQELFRVIRKGLITNMKAWDGDGQFEEPWHARALLAPFLAANYSKLEMKRSSIKQWVSEQLVNTNLSPLHNSSNTREFDHVITESASGELRIVTSDVSDETDRDTQSLRARVKIADQSNATSTLGRGNSTGQSIDQDRSIQQAESTRATEAVDMVKVKPERLRGGLSAVQKPSKNNKPQNVKYLKPGAWFKWTPQKEPAPRPKNHPQNSKAKTTGRNTKASGDTLTFKRARRQGSTILKIFVPTRGDQ